MKVVTGAAAGVAAFSALPFFCCRGYYCYRNGCWFYCRKASAMLAEMPLNQLRQAWGLSENMLAEVLYVQQPSIAKIESARICTSPPCAATSKPWRLVGGSCQISGWSSEDQQLLLTGQGRGSVSSIGVTLLYTYPNRRVTPLLKLLSNTGVTQFPGGDAATSLQNFFLVRTK